MRQTCDSMIFNFYLVIKLNVRLYMNYKAISIEFSTCYVAV